MLSHTHPKYLNKTQSIAECIAFITARVDHEYNNLPHSKQLKKIFTYIYFKNTYLFIYLNCYYFLIHYCHYFPNKASYASRAWIFVSMPDITLQVSYLLGWDVFLWGHARARSGGHWGTATAPFEQRSYCLQPHHLGEDLRFPRSLDFSKLE